MRQYVPPVLRRPLGRLYRAINPRLRASIPTWPRLARPGKYRPPVRIEPLSPAEQDVTDAFHRLYYDAWREGKGTIDSAWFGYRTLKCPLDLWIYQEIIFETRPNVIVEAGTAAGGSALFLASIFDLLGHGEVLTIDIADLPNRPRHPRIHYLLGSSVDPSILDAVVDKTRGRRTMVILDSDHSEAHVKAELEAYRRVVSVGCYLVVEDTNVNGHPAFAEFGPGPMEALDAFLPSAPEFEMDRTRERFMMTLNPRGFLRRIR